MNSCVEATLQNFVPAQKESYPVANAKCQMGTCILFKCMQQAITLGFAAGDAKAKGAGEDEAAVAMAAALGQGGGCGGKGNAIDPNLVKALAGQTSSSGTTTASNNK